MSSKSRFSVALATIVAFVAVAVSAGPVRAVVVDDFDGPTVDASWTVIDAAPLNAPPASSIYTQSATADVAGASDVLLRTIGDASSWTATLTLDSVSLTENSAFNFNFGDAIGQSHSFILSAGAGFFFSSTHGSGFTPLTPPPTAALSPFTSPSVIAVSWADTVGPGGDFSVSWSLDGGSFVGASGPLSITVDADPNRVVSLNSIAVGSAALTGTGSAVVGIERYEDNSSTGAGLAPVVPEPASVTSWLVGLALFLGLGWKRYRRASKA